MTAEEQVELIARVLCRAAGDEEDVITSSGMFALMKGGRATRLWSDNPYNADLRFWPGWMNYASEARHIAETLKLIPYGVPLDMDHVKRWKLVEDTERQPRGEMTNAA